MNEYYSLFDAPTHVQFVRVITLLAMAVLFSFIVVVAWKQERKKRERSSLPMGWCASCERTLPITQIRRYSTASPICDECYEKEGE